MTTKKKYSGFPQKLKKFNINNIKINISAHQISILEWFLKDYVTLKTGATASAS